MTETEDKKVELAALHDKLAFFSDEQNWAHNPHITQVLTRIAELEDWLDHAKLSEAPTSVQP